MQCCRNEMFCDLTVRKYMHPYRLCTVYGNALDLVHRIKVPI